MPKTTKITTGSPPNFYKVVARHGDASKLRKLKALFREIAEGIDDRIIVEAQERPLDVSEIAFLRFMRNQLKPISAPQPTALLTQSSKDDEENDQYRLIYRIQSLDLD